MYSINIRTNYQPLRVGGGRHVQLQSTDGSGAGGVVSKCHQQVHRSTGQAISEEGQSETTNVACFEHQEAGRLTHAEGPEAEKAKTTCTTLQGER
jgi:hypothetical protein